MKAFQDEHGTQWELSLTIGAAQRVRDLLGVDLLEPLEPRQKPKARAGRSRKARAAPGPALMTELELDMPLLCAVIHVLLKPQIEKAGLGDEDFADRLDGVTLRRAHDAFFSEWHDFFLHTGRLEISELMQKQTEYIQQVTQAAVEKLTGPELAETVKAKIDKTLGKSFGDLRESLDAIPDH